MVQEKKVKEYESGTSAGAVILFLLETANDSSENLLEDLARAERNSFSKKVASRWLDGTSQPRSKGREALAKYFSRHFAAVKPYWFELAVERVEELIGASGKTLSVSFDHIPRKLQELHKVARLLEGEWTTKRYAFDNSGKIAREILTIDSLEEGLVKATKYGVTSRFSKIDADPVEEKFEGQMVLIGHMICIFLSSVEHGTGRFRAIHLPYPNDDTSVSEIQWGIVSGYSSAKNEPVASRILLLKNPSRIANNALKRKKFMCFRSLEKTEDRLKRVLSNDIKNHHVSSFEDHILTTSYQDVLETIDMKTLQKHRESLKSAAAF